MHKARNEMDCPWWEAIHGGGEICTPTPDGSHLIRADAGSVLVLRHGRWGGFALGGDKEGGGKEKAEVFGWYMVPTDHKMVDMSILLRAGATIQAVDKSGKPQEDTYWCTCHQVCAMGLAVANDANGTFCVRATRGCNKVPYRGPYRVIRCAIRYLVAPPCCAIRGAIRYLVAPQCYSKSRHFQNESQGIKCHPTVLFNPGRPPHAATEESLPEATTETFENG